MRFRVSLTRRFEGEFELGAGWAESADTETEEAKGTLNEFFAAEKRAGDGVDVLF